MLIASTILSQLKFCLLFVSSYNQGWQLLRVIPAVYSETQMHGHTNSEKDTMKRRGALDVIWGRRQGGLRMYGGGRA